MNNNSPLLLIILDGWGYTQNAANNAISKAHTPNWDKLWATSPHILLSASGLDVGLPNGQMGNSEVGHMTIGAGRVIYQDLSLINKAIADGSFFNNQLLLNALQQAKQNNKNVHILGLLSPGGVHSHEQHIIAMLKMAEQNSISNLYLHAFLDGRDTPPQSAKPSLELTSKYIASIMGRFYAMDRDKRMERTQTAIDLLVNGRAKYHASSAIDALEMAYSRGETDEFVQPTQIKPVTIQSGDLVIFMNYRADRARQLCYGLHDCNLITLTEYDPKLSAQVIFPKQPITSTFSEIIADHNLSQLHIAETEKYAHVTFFFNAGKENSVPKETRTLIPSPKVATYDLAPEMSAKQITDVVIDAIKNKSFDVIICNYANADMVGHTGNLNATIKAIETLDFCLGKIVDALTEFGGEALITADHGNAETMWDEGTNQPHTAHTLNLVPLLYVGQRNLRFKVAKDVSGLQDIAPTMLALLGINKPEEMTGTILI